MPSNIKIMESYLPNEILSCLKMCRERISEIRIRRGKALSVTLMRVTEAGVLQSVNHTFSLVVDDLLMNRVLDNLCNHSLYSYMETMVEGYIAVREGFRVGVAGRAVCEGGKIKHLSSVSSLNIRVPGNFPGVSRELYSRLEKHEFQESVLIFSPPNMGKTTVLRDIVALLASGNLPRRVVVVDSRCEIETSLFHSLAHVDVLSGYPRGKGIEIATRTLSPQYIVCDEIGGYEEAELLLSAQNAGVPVIASAHAGSVQELMLRKNIHILHEAGLFSEYVGIRRLRDGKPPVFSFTSSNEVR